MNTGEQRRQSEDLLPKLLKSWLQKRRGKKAAKEWIAYETERLELENLRTILETAKINLRFQKYQWKMLKKEEKRKRQYIT